MRQRLAKLVRWVLTKLEPGGLLLAVPADALLARARVLAEAQEAYADRSGEAKRHQVLAQLVKEFPDRPVRQIALAIEAGLP